MNRKSLQQMTAEAVAFVEALEARERELALAAEDLSQESSVLCAFEQGIQHERSRVLTLISIQNDLLKRGGINALALAALRKQVREAAM